MKGYYNNPQATDEVIVTVNGMRAFRTGDKGRLDENGILSITGRIKEQYKLANGKFVVPGNVENALMSSRYVEQAFIYGRDRPHNVALLVPNLATLAAEIEGASPDLKTLLQHHGEEVRVLLEKARLEANNSPDVRHYEAVKHFAILDEPFSTDNGLLTPKLSMKRPAIEKKYIQLLEDLYT
jgi:long-chain acyl-CoA synthetase